MLITDWIVSLAEKAGIDTKDTDVIDLLSKTDLSKINVSDDLVKRVNSSFLTKEEAKNSAELKKHFYGNALDPINKKINAFFDEFEFDDSTKAEILADTSTYAQFEKTVKKIADLEKKKAGSGNKGDKAEYEKQINELNQKVLHAVNESKTKIDTLRNEYEGKILNREIDFTLGKQQLPGQYDRDVEINMARLFVDKKLDALGAIPVNENGKIVLKQKANPEMALFVDNKPITFESLTEMALAENKFLKVSGGNNPPPDNGFNRNNGGQNPPKQNPAVNSALSAIDDALKVVS